MSEPGYSIDVDRPGRLVRIKLHGFWNDRTVQDFRDSVLKLAANAPPPVPGLGRSRLLIDLCDQGLMSKDHASALQNLLNHIGATYRTAIIVSHLGLLKKQVERIGSAMRPKFFTAEDDALEWLCTESAAAADPAALAAG